MSISAPTLSRVDRIAGWPANEALIGGVTTHPVAPVACSRLLPNAETPDVAQEVLATVLQAVEHGPWQDRMHDAPVEGLLELATVFHARTGVMPRHGSLLRLWDRQVRCGALLALLLVGHENAPGHGDRSLVEYLDDWRARRVNVRHAAWHIADGNPDPEGVRRHPASRCSPDAFLTVWALAGRSSDNDPVLGEALYWLRAVHDPHRREG